MAPGENECDTPCVKKSLGSSVLKLCQILFNEKYIVSTKYWDRFGK